MAYCELKEQNVDSNGTAERFARSTDLTKSNLPSIISAINRAQAIIAAANEKAKEIEENARDLQTRTVNEVMSQCESQIKSDFAEFVRAIDEQIKETRAEILANSLAMMREALCLLMDDIDDQYQRFLGRYFKKALDSYLSIYGVEILVGVVDYHVLKTKLQTEPILEATVTLCIDPSLSSGCFVVNINGVTISFDFRKQIAQIKDVILGRKQCLHER